MFLRFSRPFTKSIQTRQYWIAPIEPTHDIVTTITDCQKWQLSYLIKKNYTNNLIGTPIYMEPKTLLQCERFSQVKKDLESDNYVFKIIKDKTIGANTFGVKVDDFNKKVIIIV
jgi:hypothetical protein